MIKFFDTNALITLQDKAFNDKFIISSVTIEELDNIKESKNKDPQIKFLARQVSDMLKNNLDMFEVIAYSPALLPDGIHDSPDNRICACAADAIAKAKDGIEFVTDDTNCFLMAKTVFGLNPRMVDHEADDYSGFITVNLSEEDMAKFYENPTDNRWDLKTNQYLVVNSLNGDWADIRKWNGKEFVALKDRIAKTNQFGTVKAKDVYQRMAIDSFNSNQVTMIKGKAGTGKTYLALASLFGALEKHEIEKIIVFCNPVATAYSARLG